MRRRAPRRASVLVGLLWCLALLSLVVVGVLHTSRMDLLVVHNYGDQVQARYLALAGIEKAKALLYHDARLRSRSGQNHSGALADAPQTLRDVPLGRGEFRVFHRAPPDEGGGWLHGVCDEESRLNLNTASAEELGRLPGMTPEVLAAIVDWRDGDNAVTTGGAELDDYASLQPPCRPRNGSFQTVRELLMVRGVPRDLFLGEDLHQNGLLDPTPDRPAASGTSAYPGLPPTGWSGMLTTDSYVANVNAAGQDRVNVQSADAASLTAVRGITPEIANAIVAYRGRNRLATLADLLDVTAAPNPDQPQRATPPPTGPPGSQAAPGPASAPTPPSTPMGPKLISENLLLDIADDLTAAEDSEMAGLVNINTAALEILACLPGVDRELAQAIISHRKSSGFFPNIAWLLRVPGMSQDRFRQIAPRLTSRSETFRILSEGTVRSTGVRARIQTIVHVGLRDLNTLSYREDDL